MGHSMFMLAYLGPETMLPMTSIIAGVVGVVMMFGRNSYRWALGAIRAVSGSKKAPAAGTLKARKIGAGPVGGIVRDAATGRAEAEVEN